MTVNDRLHYLISLYQKGAILPKELLLDALLSTNMSEVEIVLDSLPPTCMKYIQDLPFHCPPDLEVFGVDDPISAAEYIKSLLPTVEKWLERRIPRDLQ